MNTEVNFDLNHNMTSCIQQFRILRFVDKVRDEVQFTIRLGDVEGKLSIPLERYLRMRDWNVAALRDMLATEMNHVFVDWLKENRSSYASAISENDDFKSYRGLY